MRFVVFSDDWGAHPSSAQHIFKHVARDYPVLWVNTVGMRTPKVSIGDFRKAIRKIATMMDATDSSREWTNRPPLLSVIQPPMLPLPRSAIARRFNASSVVRAVQRQLDLEPIIVATVPNVADAVARLTGRKIYYCVDDFSQWPGLAQEAVRTMEDKLVANVDLVLTASPALAARFSGPHRSKVEIFPHGVDLGLYREPLPPALEWLEKLPKPRVGFYGLLDERLDQGLLAEIAQARPAWSFILAGPRAAGFPVLESLPNVHFPGSIPYQDLPALVQGLNALLVPYRVDSFTHTLAPLKLNEYLLSGCPVIASALEGIPEGHALVRVARSAADWLGCLERSFGEDIAARRDHASRLLAEHGWEMRAASLLRYCAGIDRRAVS